MIVVDLLRLIVLCLETRRVSEKFEDDAVFDSLMVLTDSKQNTNLQCGANKMLAR